MNEDDKVRREIALALGTDPCLTCGHSVEDHIEEADKGNAYCVRQGCGCKKHRSAHD